MSYRRFMAGIVLALSIGIGALGAGSTAIADETAGGETSATRRAVVTERAADCVEVAHFPGWVKAVTLFDKTGYSGDCLRVFIPDDCTASYGDNEGQYNLESLEWSNRANSAKTFNHCDVKLWDDKSCPSGGRNTPWIDLSYDLKFGADWRNRASCLRLS